VEGSITPDAIYIGNEDADATLRIENGGGVLTLVGAGSLFVNDDCLSMEGSGNSLLTIENGALLVTSGSVSIGEQGVIHLSGGYWAVKGATVADTFLSTYNVKIYGGSEWTAATSAELRVTYYDGTTNPWASSILYDAYGNRIDLTGYTVITDTSSSFGWSDCGASVNGWNKSSWYGWFCADNLRQLDLSGNSRLAVCPERGERRHLMPTTCPRATGGGTQPVRVTTPSSTITTRPPGSIILVEQAPNAPSGATTPTPSWTN